MLRFFSALLSMSLFAGAPMAAESADWIVHGKYVITMDATRRLIPDGAVAVRGSRIVGVGTQAEIRTRFTSPEIIDRSDSLVLPGLIDTHTHAPMSLFRGIADDKHLQDWLENYIFPAESKNVDPDFVKWGTRLACLEMVQAGITTYNDMYYFEMEQAETTKEAGVRGVLAETVIGFPAPDFKSWQATIDGTDKYIQRFAKDDLIVPSVAPHAVYTTPDEALIAAHRLSVKYNVPLTIHVAETEKERVDLLAKRHLTPVQLLAKLGVLDGRVIAAHSVWLDNQDLAIYKEHGTGVAHCPSSNMKLASGVAPVTEMLRLGIHVGFGTDGFAGSNDTADILQEMDIGAKLQKVIRRDPTVLPAEQALEMATLGGARVLGLDREIGSLEEGKRADLITISVAGANAVPMYNVYSQVAYATKAGNVRDVFINGRPIVRDRHPLTLNPEEIYDHAQKYKAKILASISNNSSPKR
jgi:5-methylthioadenosine/S-adenosylhomocysteine deaminase